MSDQNTILTLKKNKPDQFGVTTWQLAANIGNTGDLSLKININAQAAGICIAGYCISWKELHEAELRAEHGSVKG